MTTNRIDDAVAALETIKRTITNKLHASGKTREEYILRFTDQALTALRASTGRNARSFYDEWFPGSPPMIAPEHAMMWMDRIAAVQADALAAAQPEPRPLRDIIGQGHSAWHIFYKRNLPCDEKPDWHIVERVTLRNGPGQYSEELHDCPAIPIPKPTVTPK